jgi:hypothetical protein
VSKIRLRYIKYVPFRRCSPNFQLAQHSDSLALTLCLYQTRRSANFQRSSGVVTLEYISSLARALCTVIQWERTCCKCEFGSTFIKQYLHVHCLAAECPAYLDPECVSICVREYYPLTFIIFCVHNVQIY